MENPISDSGRKKVMGLLGAAGAGGLAALLMYACGDNIANELVQRFPNVNGDPHTLTNSLYMIGKYGGLAALVAAAGYAIANFGVDQEE